MAEPDHPAPDRITKPSPTRRRGSAIVFSAIGVCMSATGIFMIIKTFPGFYPALSGLALVMGGILAEVTAVQLWRKAADFTPHSDNPLASSDELPRRLDWNWKAFAAFLLGLILTLSGAAAIIMLCTPEEKSVFLPLVILHPNPAIATLLNLGLAGLGILMMVAAGRRSAHKACN